jgi:GDSL-like lipase/acylhydrolase family protein
MKRLLNMLLIIAFFGSLIANAFLSTVAADTPATWMDFTKDPTLNAVQTTPQEAYDHSVLEHTPVCKDRTVATRPQRTDQSERKITRCWYRNDMGLFVPDGGSGGYAIAPGESIAGLINNRPVTARFQATPSPSILLETKSESSSNYTKFHYKPRLTTTNHSNGTVSHVFSAEETLTLMYQTGAVLQGSLFHLNYSDNARYAVAVLNGAMIRIDLQTKKILHFGAPAPLGPGHNPFTKVSVTNDGKYAVATVTNINDGNRWMRVYDLEDCQDTEHTYIATAHADCQYRDFKDFLQSAITNFQHYGMAKFVDNNTLTFFHTNPTNPATLTQYIMRAPNVSAGGMKYLALGDSFASGEGAFNYELGTDEEENKCHLSRNSYPYLINDVFPNESFHSVACSAAKIVNITGGNGIRSRERGEDFEDPLKDNQYDPESVPGNNSLGDWIPGYKAQVEFVKDEDDKPNVITISVVGNDIGFSDKIKRCLEPDTCFATYEDRYEVAVEINSRFYTLANTFKRLKNVASPDAKIYVVGYPQIAHPEGACGTNVRLNRAELEFANLLASHLNTMISQAAANAGVRYVDAESAFAGHRFCEAEDHNLAVNGLTKGNDIGPDVGPFDIGVIGNESYHPTALGHRLLKDAIMTQTSSFTQGMPAADPTKTRPEVHDGLPLLQNAPKTNRQINTANYDADLTNNVVHRSGLWQSVVNGFQWGLKLNAPYKVWLNSDPVQLGTFTTDESGNLHISAQVPASVPPGFHTVHIYGQDINGQNIDIYKTIYVAASETDYDGDGIPNLEEECLAVEPANKDKDQDGVDDACDGEIAAAPADTTAPKVTGTPARQPDHGEWYNREVAINWKAVDPEPSSGAPSQPEPTMADQDGTHTYTSAESCDPAGNCAKGSLTVNLDKTAPVLGTPTWTSNPKATDATSLLSVPASDNLSGIVEAEYFLGDEDPGQGNGATMHVTEDSITTTFGKDFPTGVWKVTMRTKDAAGNWSALVSDYLVVYDSHGVRMTGRSMLLPSLTSGDVLPGLVNSAQDDRAHFGFSVRYDRSGNIHAHSDFQFGYQTGTKCWNFSKAQNCHSLYLNAKSIAWLATQGTNKSTGIFQGTATLWEDGTTKEVAFRLTGIDGERLDDKSPDRLTLKIFDLGKDPNAATPMHQVSAEVSRGDIRVLTQ